jgi:protein-S-isoprenylcysteine O-methyltransferase Ste14
VAGWPQSPAIAGISLTASIPRVGALVHRIRVEEAMLRNHLGDSYAAYERETSRLIPGVW